LSRCALLISDLGLVYFFGIFIPKDVRICGDLVFTQYPQISSNTLPQKYSTMMDSFKFSQKYTRVEGICGDIPGLSPQNPD
jgi:hypothetical protein